MIYEVEVLIARADVRDSDGNVLTVEACKSLAEQLEIMYPGCISYNEVTQTIVYCGPPLRPKEEE